MDKRKIVIDCFGCDSPEEVIRGAALAAEKYPGVELVLTGEKKSIEDTLDVMKSFFPGFVLVMEAYFKKHGEDIPVRPVYYHKKKRLMVVGEECCLQDFSRNGYDRKGIAEIFKDKVNDLYARIERGEFDLPASEKRGKRGKKQKNP